MNRSTSAQVPYDLYADRARRNEIRHHLGVARKQGVYAYPDPDGRTIILRGPEWFFPPDEAGDTELSRSLAWLLAHDGEVHDYLISLLSILKSVRSENNAAAAVAASSPSPRGSPEGVAATVAGDTGPAADRAPSILCPACDPDRPCLDHGPGVTAKDETAATVAASCFLGLVILGAVAALLKACGVAL